MGHGAMNCHNNSSINPLAVFTQHQLLRISLLRDEGYDISCEHKPHAVPEESGPRNRKKSQSTGFSFSTEGEFLCYEYSAE
jgi:hypothetical protein